MMLSRIGALICVFITIFSLSGCETTTNQLPADADIAADAEGLLFIEVTMSGIPRLRAEPELRIWLREHVDGQKLSPGPGRIDKFVVQGSRQYVLIKLPPGQYSFYDLTWLTTDLSHATIFLDCMGSFHIEAGEISYLGEFNFNAGRSDPGFFLSSTPFNFAISDDFQNGANWLHKYRPVLAKKYPLTKSIVGPWQCHSAADIFPYYDETPITSNPY